MPERLHLGRQQTADGLRGPAFVCYARSAARNPGTACRGPKRATHKLGVRKQRQPTGDVGRRGRRQQQRSPLSGHATEGWDLRLPSFAGSTPPHPFPVRRSCLVSGACLFVGASRAVVYQMRETSSPFVTHARERKALFICVHPSAPPRFPQGARTFLGSVVLFFPRAIDVWAKDVGGWCDISTSLDVRVEVGWWSISFPLRETKFGTNIC